jgi:hypothetical protein
MRETTKRRNAKLLPDLPARSRLSISLIDRTLSSQKIRRKLSQRFHEAKIGGVIEHRNPGHTMTPDSSPCPPFTAPDPRQTIAGWKAPLHRTPNIGQMRQESPDRSAQRFHNTE